MAAVQALPEPPLVIVGGRGYLGRADVAERIGADLFAADATAASRVLRARFADAG